LAPATLAGFKPRAPYLNKLIKDHFPKNRSAVILDVGCGRGALIHFARKAGYTNIHGTDASPEQTSAAERLGIDGVRHGNLMKTLQSLPDGSHDVIVAFDVVEHFTKEELRYFVDQVYRVLKKGGKWIIHTPNGDSPFGGRIRYEDFTHELAFTRQSISQLLLASGFSNVTCYEDQPIPHGFKSIVRWLLWKVIRSMLRFYLAVETGDASNKAIFSQNLLAVVGKS
jgi:2-polyprenyl-3-methyl-5-hydroxy-6-metoxy-1,4-benzoquinol methylase